VEGTNYRGNSDIKKGQTTTILFNEIFSYKNVNRMRRTHWSVKDRTNEGDESHALKITKERV
jgi:hypothetical protein